MTTFSEAPPAGHTGHTGSTSNTGSTGLTLLRRLHGRPAPGVPRWAVLAAYATALVTLPSCVWRIALGLNQPLLEHPATPPSGHGSVFFTGLWYVVALSVVSEALAYLTVGLVSQWGEVWPRWIPGFGGRQVPVLAVVIPAALGALANTLIWPYAMTMLSLGRMLDGTTSTGVHVHGWQAVVFYAAYWPLAAWGPLLGILTVHYYRRRRTQCGAPETRY